MKTPVKREELENQLLDHRRELVAFVEEFDHNHDIDDFSLEELDLWIERLRPIRLEIRAIDSALVKLSLE